MIVLFIAGLFLIVSAFFFFGVPLIVLGPKYVLQCMASAPEAKFMAGSLATIAIALVLAPFMADPLISVGEIGEMTVENFHRLNWNA
ncbi:MAG: hypothetical protein AAGK23_09045 [Pseudomonadota bacterium]